MIFQCKYVFADEAEDYYQVLFEDEIDSDKEYFLIQSQFEFPDNDECYIESNDFNYCGHYRIHNAVLTDNRLTIEIDRKSHKDIIVVFQILLENYREVQRILKIMIPHLIIK